MLRGGFIVFSGLGMMLFFSLAAAWAQEDSSRVVLDRRGESIKEDRCEGVLEATGIGKVRQGSVYLPSQARFLAERAATVRAFRNLVRAVDRLDPLLVKESAVVSTSGFIKGARVIEKTYLSGGAVEVKVVLDLSFVRSESLCEEWVSEKVSAQGLSVDLVDRRVEEISQEEWIEMNLPRSKPRGIFMAKSAESGFGKEKKQKSRIKMRGIKPETD